MPALPARWSVFLLSLLALSCTKEPDFTVCSSLYGRPAENTGLDGTQCGPACRCEGGEWTPLALPGNAVAQLQAFELSNPPVMLGSDPYVESSTPTPSLGVCAVRLQADGRRYELLDFDSFGAAQEAGAVVTHGGACGACSSLEDLGVYIENEDLTNPVRACGFKGLSEGEQSNLDCLAEIGFTPACAQIWYYNTKNTRKKCLGACLEAVGQPYHLPDGGLNTCLSCDERESGPVFKKFAGRTRRNSGLTSAICRPCDTVTRVEHEYLQR